MSGFAGPASSSSGGEVSGEIEVYGSGTAGNEDTRIITIQGTAAGTPLPVTGTITGTITSGSISGSVTANQGTAAVHANRWSVGISDGSGFVGTQANPIKTSNDFSSGEVLADQNGANGVLTFTFTNPVQRVYILSTGDGFVSRANPFGGTPNNSSGIKCPENVIIEIPIITSIVRVYSPTGATVSVWGLIR